MNLEKFPTNATAIRMLESVSNGFYDNSYVGKWLFQVMGIEVEDARKIFEELPYQAFPETATWGIRYHEQKYGIPSNESLSIQERRKRVISKRSLRAPMNPARLEKLILDMTGTTAEIIEHVGSYLFYVSLENDASLSYSLEEIYNLVKKVKPSHLKFVLNTIKRWNNTQYIGIGRMDADILTIRQVN